MGKAASQWRLVGTTNPAPDGWSYYTLGRDQGQMVEYSYARRPGQRDEPYGDRRDLYMRVTDHSDRSVVYYQAAEVRS